MSAKTSVTTWWILALMSLFLWYRNINYDRALSIFVFTLGLINLIEYGIYSGTDSSSSARAIYIILWIQCLVLSISAFILIQQDKDPDNPSITENIIHTISGWNLFLFAIIFVVCLVISFTSAGVFSATPSDTNISVSLNGGKLLGHWSWLYALGIFIPLFLLFGYYMWSDIGLALLILYVFMVAIYVLNVSSSNSQTILTTTLQYLFVGFAFLSWFVGIFSQ